MSADRCARRVSAAEGALVAADYGKAIGPLIAGLPVNIMGVRADDFDADAVAASLERQSVPRSAVMHGRIVSCLANDQPGAGLSPLVRVCSLIRALPENPNGCGNKISIIWRAIGDGPAIGGDRVECPAVADMHSLDGRKCAFGHRA